MYYLSLVIGVNGKDKKRLRCVGYVRVSTEEQAESGNSIDAQKRQIRRFCEMKAEVNGEDWKLERIYKDEGESAYKKDGKDRPNFKEMMDDIDDWDCVIATRLDRLWRSMVGSIEWFRELNEHGKHCVVIDMDLNTKTVMGAFVKDIIVRIAQLESEMIGDRVKKVFDHKFEGGNAWLTRAPLGYDLVGEKGKRRLEINEREAEIVRVAYRLALTLPQYMVAVELNKMGLRTKRTEKYPEGGLFSQPSVSHILHNPVYCAYVYRDGVLRKNGHDPIIEVEQFNAVQKAIYKNARKRKYPPIELGEDVIKCKRTCLSGRGVAVYIAEDD